MPTRRSAAAAAFLVGLGLAIPTVAHAGTSGTVIYVKNAAGCSDSGAGTASTPFCTLQVGVNAAIAGDTVEVTGDVYASGITVSNTGTASAPIVIEAAPGTTSGIGIISGSTKTTAPAFAISGASYVTIRGFKMQNNTPEFADITSSSHITLDGNSTDRDGWSPDEWDPYVDVSSSSSAVTVSRSTIYFPNSGYTSAIQFEAGSSDDTVSGDIVDATGMGFMIGSDPALISASGSVGTVVTSNTLRATGGCGTAVSLTGPSTGSTIENNIVYTSGVGCQGLSSTPSALSVNAAAVSGTTVDYNIDYVADATASAYAWAGTIYRSAAALDAATGQGAHDLNVDPQLEQNFTTGVQSTSPAIDSANSAAAGMVGTDLLGNACKFDPYVALTGSGSPAYCTRGAVQYQAQSLSANPTVGTNSPLGVGVLESQPPVNPRGYTFNWGDGQTTSTTTPSSTHKYATPGKYVITETVTDAIGETASTSTTYSTQGTDYTPYGPVRLLDTRSGIGVAKGKVASGGVVKLQIAGNGAIPADISAVVLNLTAVNGTSGGHITAYADGATVPNVSNVNYGTGTAVANEAVISVGTDGYIDLLNAGSTATNSVDLIADISGYFSSTAASDFVAVDPARVLDTRIGLGAAKTKVGANSTIALTIAGAASGTLPKTGITAVSLHVTATDAASGGFVSVYPDGSAKSTSSSLNYSTEPGSAIANTVVVPVGADGKVDLYNGSPGSVSLIADVTGYYTKTISTWSGVYVPVSPYRVVDTRKTSALSSRGSLTFFAIPNSSSNGFTLSNPGDAYVMNLTVTQPTGNGYITAYPAEHGLPGTSNVNYLTGQTVAVLTQTMAGNSGTGTVTITNSELSGTVEVIVDVFGYYTQDS